MTPSGRSVARALLPCHTYDAASFAVRRLRDRRTVDDAATTLDRRFIKEFGPVVQQGPFAGLKYDRKVVGQTTAVAAKLVGSYEAELRPTVERLLESPMTTFVDIGSAEGYYAVGVGLRRRDVQVITFDIDATARQMCRLLARANAVSIDLREEATPEFLAGLGEGTVVFSDCEGAEGHLLDPSRAPALNRLPIVVEVHDFLQPGCTELLSDRFAASHSVSRLDTGPRDPAGYPALQRFSEDDQRTLLSEGRPSAMSWLVMDPR